MNERSEAAASAYVFGDQGAGNEVGFPKKEIRKMRVSGKLKGAFAKTGHRSIVYHRDRLRRRIAEAFKADQAAE